MSNSYSLILVVSMDVAYSMLNHGNSYSLILVASMDVAYSLVNYKELLLWVVLTLGIAIINMNRIHSFWILSFINMNMVHCFQIL